MRIAVASSDGKSVNEHFGRASQFWIYDVAENGLELTALRSVTAYGSGERTHAFNPERFRAVTEAMQDCQRVYTAKIGERPAAELLRAGIEPIQYQGPIERMPL